MTTTPPPSPWPFSDVYPTTLIVGGSFNPPHAAHTALARYARDTLMPDAGIVYIPTTASPFKAPGGTSSADRLEMVRRAIDPDQREAAWSDEVDRGGVNYTVETLRRAAVVAPGVKLRLLLGADQAVAFHRWREPREIISLAWPMVVLRAPIESRIQLEQMLHECAFWSDAEVAAWGTWTIDAPLMEVSSSSIREIIRKRGVDAVPESWITPAVRAFIADRGLYADE